MKLKRLALYHWLRRDMSSASTSSHPAMEILWDLSNGKIRIPDQYHWICLFKTILTPPSRQIYIKYTKRYESKTQKIASTFNLRFLSQFSMDLKIVSSISAWFGSKWWGILPFRSSSKKLWNWTFVAWVMGRFDWFKCWRVCMMLKDDECVKNFGKGSLNLRNWIQKKWVRVRFWQGVLGSLSLRKWMGDDPLFIGKWTGMKIWRNKEVWREIEWSPKMRSVTWICSKLN